MGRYWARTIALSLSSMAQIWLAVIVLGQTGISREACVSWARLERLVAADADNEHADEHLAEARLVELDHHDRRRVARRVQ